MTRPNIAIDYLANCPELIDELARLSWKEWQEIYQQRKQTLEDSLKNYRERMNTDRLPLTFCCGPRGTGGKLPRTRRDGVITDFADLRRLIFLRSRFPDFARSLASKVLIF